MRDFFSAILSAIGILIAIPFYLVGLLLGTMYAGLETGFGRGRMV
jgi:hypothetical protein